MGATPPSRQPTVEEQIMIEQRYAEGNANRMPELAADLVKLAPDLIVVMDPSQRSHICERFGRLPRNVVVLGDFDPTPVDTRTIRDPVDQKREVFDEVYERIARCVRELATVLAGAGS